MTNNNFNITRLAPQVPGIPVSGGGQSHKEAYNRTKIATEETAPFRKLPPLTRYNPESGIAEPMEDLGALAQEDEVAPPKVKQQTEQQTQDRHAKWKAEQAAKKAEREEKQAAKQVQNQANAASLLQKGDLIGAAKALGIPASELVTLVNNSVLQIPKEEVKLSAEEQLKADQEKFRQDRLDFEREMSQWKYNSTADSYIRENINPVLLDQDKFEYLHKVADINKVKQQAYEYMNNHYRETGEELNAIDVLESMEETFYQEHVQALERAKGIKKVSNYFAAPSKEDEPSLQDEQETEVEMQPQYQTSPHNVMRVSNPDPGFEEEEERDFISQAAPMNLSSVNSVQRKKPGQQEVGWHSLTREEKLARIRAEDEAERRKAAKRK